jgi:diaminopimelate decarboxylase
VGEGVLRETSPFHLSGGILHCEEVSLADLAARYGTPLYVYSRAAIRNRYEELSRALSPVPHLIAYSVKANGNLAVLRALAEMGAGADIVSGGELDRALRAGIPPERIVFSGVGKTDVELAAGIAAGIYAFNVESEQELEHLSELATLSGGTAAVALRVNPNIESPTPHAYTRTGHAATKFGVPIGDALRLYARAASLPGVRVRGIDFHVGSQLLDAEPYSRALSQVMALVAQLRASGTELEFVDVGGGLGIAYADEEGISARSFADAILPQLADSGLRLLVEPGRFLVGEAGVLLTRVLVRKEGGGRCFLVADAGMSDLLRPSHYSGYHAIEPVAPRIGEERRVDVVGPICETGDFLALDRMLPPIGAGELLAVHAVGAYGFAMASTYNQRPRPAEVMVDGADARVVRRRETLEDLLAFET